MESVTGTSTNAAPSTLAGSRSTAISFVLHAVLLLSLAGILHHTVRIAPLRLPGTTTGVAYLPYYAQGSPQKAAAAAPLQKPVKSAAPTPAKALAAPVQQAPQPPAPAAAPGTGSTVQSGLGEGDVSIARQKYFPYPRPDLSVLAPGTNGDVILDAVVDEHGTITQITLMQGLGDAIDNSVIATVKSWSYFPATRNGIPVPSEQELHFHYIRA